jgi:hypothetical protein
VLKRPRPGVLIDHSCLWLRLDQPPKSWYVRRRRVHGNFDLRGTDYENGMGEVKAIRAVGTPSVRY